MKRQKIRRKIAVAIIFAMLIGTFCVGGNESKAVTFYSEGDAVYKENKKIVGKVMISNDMYVTKDTYITVCDGAKLIVYGNLYVIGTLENFGDLTVFGDLYCFKKEENGEQTEKVYEDGKIEIHVRFTVMGTIFEKRRLEDIEIPFGGSPSHIEEEGKPYDEEIETIDPIYPTDTPKETDIPQKTSTAMPTQTPTKAPTETPVIDYKDNPNIEWSYETKDSIVFDRNAIIDGNVLFTKDIFIKNGSNVIVNNGSNVKFEKNIYVFGSLTNNGTMEVHETLNCLDYNGMFTAGSDYGYGYFKNYGKVKISTLNVKSDYLGIRIPDREPTITPTLKPTSAPTNKPISTPTSTPTNEQEKDTVIVEKDIVFSGNAKIKNNTKYEGNVYIKKGVTVTIEKGSEVEFDKSVYVWGTLENYGEIIGGDKYCLDYNGFITAGADYGYGYIKNYGVISGGNLTVSTSWILTDIPDEKQEETAAPTQEPTEKPTSTYNPSTALPDPSVEIVSTGNPTNEPTNEPTRVPTSIPTKTPEQSKEPEENKTTMPTSKPVYTPDGNGSKNIIKTNHPENQKTEGEGENKKSKKPKIKVKKKSFCLKIGKKAKINAKKKSGAKGKIKYKSSNKKIATVSKKGVIKAKRRGHCYITVRCKNAKEKIFVAVSKQ